MNNFEAKINGMAKELIQAEEAARELKSRITDACMQDPAEAIYAGFLSINWSQIKRSRTER